jgi:hypothetical protein
MQVVVLRMMAAVAKHAPPHKHSTTKLGINSNYSFWARFLLCCIGEGVSGEAIEQKIKLGRSNIHGWLKESTTEFGNMLEKRLNHWGFLFFYLLFFSLSFFFFFPIPTYKLHFLSILFYMVISQWESHICISRCHSVAFFISFFYIS